MPVVEERWLTVSEFCTLYGLGYSAARIYIKKKIVESKRFTTEEIEGRIEGPGRVRGTHAAVRIKDPLWRVAGTLDSPDKPRSLDEMFLLRPTEVAAILGVTTRRVRQLAAAGKIKFYELPVRHRRYSLGAVRQMLAIQAGGKKKKASTVRKAVVAYARKRLAESPLAALD